MTRFVGQKSCPRVPAAPGIRPKAVGAVLQTIMDYSKLVMTVVGLGANLGTAITLIKNGEVGGIFISGVVCGCGQRGKPGFRLGDGVDLVE